jgi:hypothetical protein
MTIFHLTGDRIRILLLNLPFVFRDLIAPEVVMPSARHHHIVAYSLISYMISYLISRSPCPCAALQVKFVNDAIRKAQPGSKLHGLAPITDPSDEIIDVHLDALRWDMQQRRYGLTAAGSEKLHALSVEPSPHYPIPLQGRSVYWRRLCRHAAGQGQRQQALRG